MDRIKILAGWLHPKDLFPKGVNEHARDVRPFLNEIPPDAVEQITEQILPTVVWQEATPERLIMNVSAAGTGQAIGRSKGDQLAWSLSVPVDLVQSIEMRGTAESKDPKRDLIRVYVKGVLGCLTERASDNMSPAVRQAFNHAVSQFKTIVWPEARRVSFPDHQLHHIETSVNTDLGLLDRISGIDAILSGPNGLRTLALRIREKDWASFTLRDTELPKRNSAMTHNTARASMHLQAHIENGKLVSYGLIDVDVLTRYLMEHRGLETSPTAPVRRMKNRGDGDHDFLVVDFADLRAAKVPFFWYPTDYSQDLSDLF